MEISKTLSRESLRKNKLGLIVTQSLRPNVKVKLPKSVAVADQAVKQQWTLLLNMFKNTTNKFPKMNRGQLYEAFCLIRSKGWDITNTKLEDIKNAC